MIVRRTMAFVVSTEMDHDGISLVTALCLNSNSNNRNCFLKFVSDLVAFMTCCLLTVEYAVLQVCHSG